METESLKTLKIIPRNLNEIVRSWIRLFERTPLYGTGTKPYGTYLSDNLQLGRWIFSKTS
jgi:hypothetical protein